ncbi:hypothetical protein, partial [Endozoicomonas arenosclerae]|uniref:hypothetical protein n=1 Tax=Endozoicomonas arenosclerae TaxID=1633495 RepID=UPI001C12BA76
MTLLYKKTSSIHSQITRPQPAPQNPLRAFIKTLEDVRSLLSQADCLEPGWDSKDECYRWIELTLSHFKYRSLSKGDKGLIRRYLTIGSGYSRAQVTRLINQYISKGSVKRRQCTTRGFQTRYTKADIR